MGKELTKEEKELLFSEGGVLTDSVYEFMLRVVASPTDRAKDKEFRFLLPGGIGLCPPDEWADVADDLTEALNNKIKIDGKGWRVFKVNFEVMRFSGKMTKKMLEMGGNNGSTPYVVPRTCMDVDVDDIANDMFNIFLDLGEKTLKEEEVSYIKVPNQDEKDSE